MAKPMLVTLPFVLLLLDAWPLRRLGLRAVLEKWPMFLLVAASSAVTVIAQRSAGAVADLTQIALGDRVANAVVASAAYVVKAFVPKAQLTSTKDYDTAVQMLLEEAIAD